MNKKYIIIVLALLILVLVGGGYYWHWQSREVGSGQPVEKNEAEIIVATSSGEILPSISINPLENKPDINPIDQTNPYKDIKTNPFE